jgi:hypothetical protein
VLSSLRSYENKLNAKIKRWLVSTWRTCVLCDAIWSREKLLRSPAGTCCYMDHVIVRAIPIAYERSKRETFPNRRSISRIIAGTHRTRTDRSARRRFLNQVAQICGCWQPSASQTFDSICTRQVRARVPAEECDSCRGRRRTKNRIGPGQPCSSSTRLRQRIASVLGAKNNDDKIRRKKKKERTLGSY